MSAHQSLAKHSIAALATAVVLVLSTPGTSLAATACKGLEEAKCVGNAECTWVSGYTRKDGKTVAPYCQGKGNKSKGAAEEAAQAPGAAAKAATPAAGLPSQPAGVPQTPGAAAKAATPAAGLPPPAGAAQAPGAAAKAATPAAGVPAQPVPPAAGAAAKTAPKPAAPQP
jgi:hypothetical protein